MQRIKSFLAHNLRKVLVLCLLLLVIGLGGYLQLHHIGKSSFWLDEAFTFEHVKNSIAYAVKSDPNMSLYYALAYYWVRLLPKLSDGRLRALSAIFSILTIPVVFLIGNTLSKDKRKANAIGLVAALLVALNVFVIQYAQEFRSYSLTLFLATLSTFFMIKAVEGQEIDYRWFMAYIITSAASFYSHFYAIFLFATQIICLVILYFQKNKSHFKTRKLLYCGIAWFCLVLPIGIVALIKGPGQISWISPLSLKTFENFLLTLSGDPDNAALLILNLLAGCIGLILINKDDLQDENLTAWKYILMVSCLCIPVCFAVAYSLLFKPIFYDKYLIYVLPYLSLLAANGIVSISCFGWKIKKWAPGFLLVGICFFGLFFPYIKSSIQLYYAVDRKEDWRDAMQLVSNKCTGSLVLYYSTYIETPAFYYDPALETSQVDWWNALIAENLDASQLSAALPSNYDHVCLVVSHPREKLELIKTAISKNYTQVAKGNFTGIEIDIFKR